MRARKLAVILVLCFGMGAYAQEYNCFTFTIQADSHFAEAEAGALGDSAEWVGLYELMLSNVAADKPDLHFTMGDFVCSESYQDPPAEVASYAEAITRNEDQRDMLLAAGIDTSAFFFVNGNHEGDQGWEYTWNDSGYEFADSVCYWQRDARLATFFNPPGPVNGDATYERYYAIEHESALFVILDPFAYTTTLPHGVGAECSGCDYGVDRWRWTLGEDQYNWFYTVLDTCSLPWKFVFIHQLVGGYTNYGRGGIEAADWFEWGGNDTSGVDVFSTRRSGWAHGSIHNILVSEDVDIVFFGHDHVYVKQIKDGVIYQHCPRANDPNYGTGFYTPGGYASGTVANNSGHLRVSVNPGVLKVEYVRAILSGDEPLIEDADTLYNQSVSHSWSLIP